MKRKIRTHTLAEEDLIAIWKYSLEQWDEHRADAYLDELDGAKARRAEDAGDGWTLIGPKDSVTAQYEHTIVVGRSGPIIVTDLHGLPGHA